MAAPLTAAPRNAWARVLRGTAEGGAAGASGAAIGSAHGSSSIAPANLIGSAAAAPIAAAADQSADKATAAASAAAAGPGAPMQGQRCCRCCGTTETAEWRAGPDGVKTFCNPCGVAYQRHVLGRWTSASSGAQGLGPSMAARVDKLWALHAAAAARAHAAATGLSAAAPAANAPEGLQTVTAEPLADAAAATGAAASPTPAVDGAITRGSRSAASGLPPWAPRALAEFRAAAAAVAAAAPAALNPGLAHNGGRGAQPPSLQPLAARLRTAGDVLEAALAAGTAAMLAASDRRAQPAGQAAEGVAAPGAAQSTLHAASSLLPTVVTEGAAAPPPPLLTAQATPPPSQALTGAAASAAPQTATAAPAATPDPTVPPQPATVGACAFCHDLVLECDAVTAGQRLAKGVSKPEFVHRDCAFWAPLVHHVSTLHFSCRWVPSNAMRIDCCMKFSLQCHMQCFSKHLTNVALITPACRKGTPCRTSQKRSGVRGSSSAPSATGAAPP